MSKAENRQSSFISETVRGVKKVFHIAKRVFYMLVLFTIISWFFALFPPSILSLGDPTLLAALLAFQQVCRASAVILTSIIIYILAVVPIK